MKKKAIMITIAVVLLLGIGGTCVGETWNNRNTAEIEKDIAKETANNKKENEKVQGAVSSEAKGNAVEANTENESEAENVSPTNETSNNGNGNTGNASVTNASAGNRTGNNSSASSGNNSGNGTGSSTGNSSSTPSGNNSNSNNNAPAQTAHTHTWVHVEATGHYETVVVQDAWDEEVPVYENVAHDICNVCGADITNLSESDVTNHMYNHMVCGENAGWHTEWRYEQAGTQKVHHEAVTEQRWVQDSPAYDVCSGCGATK